MGSKIIFWTVTRKEAEDHKQDFTSDVLQFCTPISKQQAGSPEFLVSLFLRSLLHFLDWELYCFVSLPVLLFFPPFLLFCYARVRACVCASAKANACTRLHPCGSHRTESFLSFHNVGSGDQIKSVSYFIC